ncbi:MAG: cytochrome c oxidase subunit 3 [Verrucomicrobiota bacterium]
MEIPYTVTARPDTGLWNSKIAIWLFLASEVMLFGGLFSSYIFLRMGADYPWPIHELDIWPGAINTAVLILSSVTVVFAWAALKLRSWLQFQIYIIITILCALGFMVIKSFEYKGKLTHYAARFKDGVEIAGHLEKKDNVLKFRADSLVVQIKAGHGQERQTAGYLSGLGFPVETKALKAKREKDRAAAKLIWEEERRAWEALSEAEKEDRTEPALFAPSVIRTTLTLDLGGEEVVLKPSEVAKRTGDTYTLRDGSRLLGEEIDSPIVMAIDKIDLQRLATSGEATDLETFTADAIEIEKSYLKNFPALYELWEKHKKYVKKSLVEEGAVKPRWEAYVVKKFEKYAKKKDGQESDYGSQPEADYGIGGKAAEGDDHALHPVVEVPRDGLRFFSNYGPAKNTYYAIYFTMTGLHGLHVIGGAVVFAYLLFVGKKFYDKNPEWMANRVEATGLFWHLVDLIWIFLFPLLYLL